MKILIATDAWHPQVNGVVRTLTSLAKSAAALGADIGFLTPDGFPSMPLPTYPGLRIALPNRREIARRIAEAAPDAIHIATEGPIGWAVRAYCRRRKLAFTTSYTTRFPEYVAVRTGLPLSVGYAVMRHFHAASSTVMVATDSLRQELSARGFRKLGFWTRGVDTELFNPHAPAALDLPRPVFMTMGRVAVEKNLEAFLSLDLPGSKVVVGDGPQKAQLAKQYPDAIFLGENSPEPFGDYLAGPNHVLPTGGSARFSSPLGVYDFQKRTSVIGVSREGAQRLGRIAATLAEGEGLQAHARSATARIQ